MSTVTVSLPEEDLDFLRSYSETQGTSAEMVLARQARALRQLLERPLHPDIVAASGILQETVDAEAEYKNYLEKKYS